MTRDQLIAVYLDWVNNYASIQYYANVNGFTFEEARQLLALAKQVCEAKHPEA